MKQTPDVHPGCDDPLIRSGRWARFVLPTDCNEIDQNHHNTPIGLLQTLPAQRHVQTYERHTRSYDLQQDDPPDPDRQSSRCSGRRYPENLRPAPHSVESHLVEGIRSRAVQPTHLLVPSDVPRHARRGRRQLGGLQVELERFGDQEDPNLRAALESSHPRPGSQRPG